MLKRVTIIGYGTMGKGIASSFVRGRHEVTVVSRNPERITDVPEGIEVVKDLPDAAPDLCIEAIPEKMELKTALFTCLEQAYRGESVLATNTSGLSIEQMATQLRYPDRFIGIHYFHPAELFPAVEVIPVEQTDQKILEMVKQSLQANGQEPVIIQSPIAGFLINRLQHALLHEAFSLIEQNIVTAEDVDTVCKKMFGPRMCVTGLIEQKDISGLDTTAATQRNLVPQLNHSGIPTVQLQNMVSKGNLGIKTGKGYYDWRGRDIETYTIEVYRKLTRILELLSQ